jgi:hypothetical protein
MVTVTVTVVPAAPAGTTARQSSAFVTPLSVDAHFVNVSPVAATPVTALPVTRPTVTVTRSPAVPSTTPLLDRTPVPAASRGKALAVERVIATD